MISGISFGKGVIFHNKKVIACAEIKKGVIHTWSEEIGVGTLPKIWWRVSMSLPWYYNLFHIFLVYMFFFANLDGVNPLWFFVYLAGFHFVFPAQLKKFHGAEHKVFSYGRDVTAQDWEKVKRASIVNRGCSTNVVTFFFVFFFIALLFISLFKAIIIGVIGIGVCNIAAKYEPRLIEPFFRLSASLQRKVTTKEPDRSHLETAIRSYALFQYQWRIWQEENGS
ncbi:DUF1385 domain-containing protein [Brevibacillus daliensis]|uniref:DUF1385 domain-containing protein n=1 Tax=Brevibacillus daliensis TaxID=2892995 RepID=UPI001E37D764|nr:DUF1385 domain-containing protein [Brevibacillus daliensis]